MIHLSFSLLHSLKDINSLTLPGQSRSCQKRHHYGLHSLSLSSYIYIIFIYVCVERESVCGGERERKWETGIHSCSSCISLLLRNVFFGSSTMFLFVTCSSNYIRYSTFDFIIIIIYTLFILFQYLCIDYLVLHACNPCMGMSPLMATWHVN